MTQKVTRAKGIPGNTAGNYSSWKRAQHHINKVLRPCFQRYSPLMEKTYGAHMKGLKDFKHSVKKKMAMNHTLKAQKLNY